MTDLEQLKALVAAGEKATQGEVQYIQSTGRVLLKCRWDSNAKWKRTWRTIASIVGTSIYRNYKNDAKFFTQSANSRQALKRLIERHEAMEKVMITAIGAVGRAAGLLPDDEIIQNAYTKIQKALETGE